MANECLVTKLKGTVQNDNLPYLGQLTLGFLELQGATNAYLYGFNGASYKVVGNLHFKNSSTPITSETPEMPSTGTLVGGYVQFTGTGKLLVYPRYGLTGMALQTACINFNLNELYYDTFTNGFTLRPEGSSPKYIFDKVDKKLQYGFSLGNFRVIELPLIKDADYSNIWLDDSNTERAGETKVEFKYYNFTSPITGDKANDYGFNINNILSCNNISLYKIGDISVNGAGWRVSDIAALTPFCKDTSTKFVVAGGTVGGDIISELSQWTMLDDINCGNTEEEWAPLFNAWKAAGVSNRTVTFHCKGTINGVSIPGHHIVFDASGNWTVIA